MECINTVEQVFRKYAQFHGRSDRQEYWYFMLFHNVVSFAFAAFSVTSIGMLIFGLYSMATIIPVLSVSVRRLHDIRRSGVWLLIGLIPVVGWIMLVIWFCQESDPGDNQYGRNPNGYSAVSAYQQDVRGALAVKCISGSLKGQVYRIGSAGVQFGRTPSCHVRFPNGTPGVSSQHCCIRMEHGTPMLIDLNSKFGTIMAGGKKLPPHYPEPLQVGSRFFLGSPQNEFQIVYQ